MACGTEGHIIFFGVSSSSFEPEPSNHVLLLFRVVQKYAKSYKIPVLGPFLTCKNVNYTCKNVNYTCKNEIHTC